jgi:hypothetical protein
MRIQLRISISGRKGPLAGTTKMPQMGRQIARASRIVGSGLVGVLDKLCILWKGNSLSQEKSLSSK